MKKRNQLVSTLLTGILISGLGTATIGTVPVVVTAEGSDVQTAGDSGDSGTDGTEAETEETARGLAETMARHTGLPWEG